MLKKLKLWIKNWPKLLKRKKKHFHDDWDNWHPDHDLFI